MQRSYIDTSGLDTLVDEIKALVNTKLSLSGGHVTGPTEIDYLTMGVAIAEAITYDSEPTYTDSTLTSKQQVSSMISGKEDTSNKTTTLNSSSTNTQYPSAKLVYDNLALKENISNKVTSISSSSDDTHYPSAKAVYGALSNFNVTSDADWKFTPTGTSKWYFYEQADITTYDLPHTNCAVWVMERGTNRGVALAMSWSSDAPRHIWKNVLHDTWRGWQLAQPFNDQGQVSSINFSGLSAGKYVCRYTGSATGNPSSGSEGLCLTMINDSPTYGAQICSSNGGFYFREYNGGVWGSWERTESTGNKVTSITSSSTDTQYPSAKAVYTNLKYVPYSGRNVAWQDAVAGDAQWFFYEGASTSTYSLPSSNCLVVVFKQSAVRGYAIAFSWPNGTSNVWHNNLHDSWRGWQSWH